MSSIIQRWNHRAVALDQRRQMIEQPLDLLRRARLAQDKAQLPHQPIRVGAHCREDVTRLLLPGCASTATARADADFVQVEQNRVAVQAAQSKTGMPCQTLSRVPGQRRFGDRLQDAQNQVIAQRRELGDGFGALRFSKAQRCCQPDDQRDGFGAGSPVRLLPTADDLRLKRHRAARIEHTNPFGTVKLVPG